MRKTPKHAKHAKPAASKATGDSKGSRKRSGKPTFTEWVESHGVLVAALLSIACSAALLVLFFFVAFTDFSASADFVYSQF